ncbi:MAG TPA: LON peptidase substrate-binding domain-containing protein, partial [Gemmatimonadales bacterium]|nr:LON peptidase substrate-binding domain-containing protein [Gemmatimonadales bacterium]
FGLVPPGPNGQPPTTGVIGTVAEIRGHQALEDGRSTIVVEGSQRFMLRRYLAGESPYLVGLVDPFEDEDEPEADLAPLLPELRQLADRIVEARRILGLPGTVPEWAADGGGLSLQIASVLDVDFTFKQRFLGIRLPSHRIQLLLQLLPGIAADLEARAQVKRRASRNGTGGAHPDIVIT